MSTQLVLTVIGPDRPGLVSSLSDAVALHGGNWLTSELAHLAGNFAGIVLIELPEANRDALTDDVRRLDDQGLLEVRITAASSAAPAAVTDSQRWNLRVLGHDRPGIIREITAVLAAHQVTIVELSTDVSEAPQAGGTLFSAEAVVALPAATATEQVQAALEDLAAELMVDLDLDRPA